MTVSQHDHRGDRAEGKQPYPLHAIQLVDLRVIELNLKANLDVEKDAPAGNFELGTGHGKYDQDTHRIQVKVSASLGQEDGSRAPFVLKVELIGLFTVDPDRFPAEHVAKWASTNAPLVLYPYLREQVYGITSRAGFNATLLPLLEIPTFRLMQQPTGETKVVTTRE
ncbi:protein-export chaperone SecB [Paraburkholderia terrae]|uniref:protein-export chaperone SecB n=1 Tax=Paraburkholderia terrae TaxID=311230 RepID=UPI00296B01B8|nr:protein-export chaperone SecB [Paraburkholderia terrae]MDW3662004.1 protein-export chaperone SecB [Paraburkholderia terrae]